MGAAGLSPLTLTTGHVWSSQADRDTSNCNSTQLATSVTYTKWAENDLFHARRATWATSIRFHLLPASTHWYKWDNLSRSFLQNICQPPSCLHQLKRCVDKLSKSTYSSLAHITVFVISGLQSVIYWKNFCHVWWVSYGLYVINCICTLMRTVFWHTCTFSGYINRLCRHTVESYCVSWIYCPIIC